MSNTNKYIQEYFGYYNKYRQLYGSNTLVFIQTGSFYEAYATDKQGPNLINLSGVLNILCTRMNKYNPEISNDNPYIIAFPLVSSKKFIDILTRENYSVILISRISDLRIGSDFMVNVKCYFPQNKENNSRERNENHDCKFCLRNVSTYIITFPCGHDICADCSNSIFKDNDIVCPFCKNGELVMVCI